MNPSRAVGLGTVLGTFILVLSSGGLGCASGPSVRLEQPFAPSAQRSLLVAPDAAVMAERGEDTACLISLGLPGSRAGPRAYAAYFRFLPKPGEQRIGLTSDDDGGVGFLVQEVGELRGKSTFDSGTLRYQPKDWLHAAPTLELNAIAADGTRLSGRITLTEDAGTLKSFERRYMADVAALGVAASQPTSRGSTATETPSRRGEGKESEP